MDKKNYRQLRTRVLCGERKRSSVADVFKCQIRLKQVTDNFVNLLVLVCLITRMLASIVSHPIAFI